MHPETQRRHFPLWLRWLGWTALFALVCLATTLADAVFRHTAWPLPFWFSLAMPLFAAVLIGARFRSGLWALGPPVPVLALLVSVGLRDPGTALLLGWLMLPIIFLSIAYGAAALIGVWWGIQRDEDVVRPAGRLGSDPSLWLLCLTLAVLAVLPLLGSGLVYSERWRQARMDSLQLQQYADAGSSRFRRQIVPPEVVEHLEAGLDIPLGFLRGARFVNARQDLDTWVIAADVQGWGYWGDADYAVWTIKSDYARNRPTLRASDPITSLNALAAQHSAFPFDAKNPGTIDEAIGCADRAILQF